MVTQHSSSEHSHLAGDPGPPDHRAERSWCLRTQVFLGGTEAPAVRAPVWEMSFCSPTKHLQIYVGLTL